METQKKKGQFFQKWNNKTKSRLSICAKSSGRWTFMPLFPPITNQKSSGGNQYHYKLITQNSQFYCAMEMLHISLQVTTITCFQRRPDALKISAPAIEVTYNVCNKLH